ncbi:PDZ domain-containing protein [Chryseobacterium scophthalmum]|uniref:PDZ domain-containing protein n=3 Tax=Chryseobacterium TaxID=59732 RepID=UPI000C9DE674|nr:PDZ domain-containing protein [Chryseobacterium scophthalmum]
MSRLPKIVLFSFLLISCSKNIYSQKEQHINLKNNGKHVSIHLKINQYKKGNFYFDTASPWLIIDSTFYKNQKMSFNYYSKQEITGVGDNRQNMIKVLDTIKISANNNAFSSKFNLIHNLRYFLGKNIDGIVGFGNFGNTPFEIDYVNQKISLNPQINDSYQEVSIKFDGSFMYIPMELILHNGNNIQGDFLIDTGSNKTVLTSEFAKNKDIIYNKKVTYKNSGGIGGLHTGCSFFTPKLKMNKFTLNERQIDVSNDSAGALSKNKNYIGIIGNDILDRFDIIYHPTQNKIWMRPNKNFSKPSDDLYKSFILIETGNINKGWIVGSIYEKNSDAYQKGLRHEDEIIEINNKSVKKLSLENFNRQLKANQKLKLKVKRGEVYFEIDTYLNIFLKKND